MKASWTPSPTILHILHSKHDTISMKSNELFPGTQIMDFFYYKLQRLRLRDRKPFPQLLIFVPQTDGRRRSVVPLATFLFKHKKTCHSIVKCFENFFQLCARALDTFSDRADKKCEKSTLLSVKSRKQTGNMLHYKFKTNVRHFERIPSR